VPHISGLEAWLHTLFSVLYGFLHGFRTVHIHGIGPAFWAPLARFLGMKVIVTHHGADYLRQKWGRLGKLVLMLGEYMGVIFANRVIAVADYIKTNLEKKYNRQKVTIIPNGISQPVRDTDCDYIKSLGLMPGGYFLSVSRFVPEKGLEDLIMAYALLDQPALKLVLAGAAVQPTAFSRGLEHLARHHGCVLSGYISGKKLHQLYTNAACFVFPSYHEGFSFALLEAASYGLPILASAIPANREMALDPVCFFPAGDRKSLALKMRQMMENPKSSEAVARLSMEKYSWDGIARQTLGVYIGTKASDIE